MAGKEAAKGWKRGAGTERCPQICHASVCQRDLLIHPDPPLCQRGRARHLLARSIMQTEASMKRAEALHGQPGSVK